MPRYSRDRPARRTPSAVDAARMFGAYKFLDWFGLGPKF